MDCGKIGSIVKLAGRNACPTLTFVVLTGLLPGCYAQSIAGCPVLPADNVWNTAVDQLPADSNSATYVQTIGAAKTLHADFGAGATLGIPFVVVPGNQRKVPVAFEYADESDPGPYPAPPNAPIEGGAQSKGDRHVLIVDKDHCVLYELYSAYPQPDGSWKAGSGAIFHLRSNSLRPAGWTSSDAAGLPVVPGLLRYDDVAQGELKHAVRFTIPETRREYIWPATHFASNLTDRKYPPMGARFRLRKDFDVSSYSPTNQVILRGLKKYGMILADNGSPWFISGAPDDRWDNDDLHNLSKLRGSDFEAVNESSLMVSAKSGRVKGGSAVVNGATWNSGPVAPREIVTIYGSGFGTNATVRFDGVAAQVLYAGPDQINAIVPDSIAGDDTTDLSVTVDGGVALAETLPVAELSPGLFTLESTGRDQVAALNQTNRVNTPADPAAKGSVIALYGTGGGSFRSVSVEIGGLDAPVRYAGPAPQAVNGLMQVNALIPDTVASGSVSVVLTIDGAVSRPDAVLSVKQ